MRLAFIRWNVRDAAALAGGLTALEVGRPRALVRDGCARALVRPFTAAAVTARGFCTAADVGWVVGAETYGGLAPS